ncbi:MAG: HEAT repeat domain-containing protein [Polyangiaceae bacterium]
MLAPPPLPRNLDAALRDLGSPRAPARASAAADLVRHAVLHDEVRARALPLLETALKSDDAPEVRAAAAVGLGDLRAVEALAALLVAIEDANIHVRQMAINALGEVGDPRALPRLERALSDARPEVRYQAIIAYAKIARDAGDVDRALVRACGDADDAVRYIALRIAEERIEGSGETAGVPPSVEMLREARTQVEKDAPHVKLAAAILLAKVGEEPLGAARDVILRAVRGGRLGAPGPDKEDEREAVEVAGAIDLREAIPDLERRAWGLGSLVRDTCAWHAKIALARMGHPRATAEILKDLESARGETRAAAVVAAGRARIGAAREKLAGMAGRGGEGVDPQLVADAVAKLGG